jgi:hypothetical protein
MWTNATSGFEDVDVSALSAATVTERRARRTGLGGYRVVL